MAPAHDANTTGVGIESRNTNVTVRNNRIAGIIAHGRPTHGSGTWMGTAIAISGAGDGFHLAGAIQSAPSSQYRLKFFASPACDASGHGEGRVFVGATMVTTNCAGSATYDATFSAAVTADWVLTSTATLEPLGATSEFSPCATIMADTSPVTGDLPNRLTLLDAYPNPFNPRTTLSFVLPTSGAVDFSVHDLAGKHVATLAGGFLEAGPHQVVWAGMDDQGRRVPSGMYVARSRQQVRNRGAFTLVPAQVSHVGDTPAGTMVRVELGNLCPGAQPMTLVGALGVCASALLERVDDRRIDPVDVSIIPTEKQVLPIRRK